MGCRRINFCSAHFLLLPGTVSGWELLDSRWNGNEALRWTTDRGPFFVKMNRVEDMSVFMTEVRSRRLSSIGPLSSSPHDFVVWIFCSVLASTGRSLWSVRAAEKRVKISRNLLHVALLLPSGRKCR